MKAALRILGLCAIIAGSMSIPARAANGQMDYAIDYYSDETYTVLVGQFVRFCDGSKFHSGTPTLYTQEFDYDCP